MITGYPHRPGDLGLTSPLASPALLPPSPLPALPLHAAGALLGAAGLRLRLVASAASDPLVRLRLVPAALEAGAAYEEAPFTPTFLQLRRVRRGGGGGRGRRGGEWGEGQGEGEERRRGTGGDSGISTVKAMRRGQSL